MVVESIVPRPGSHLTCACRNHVMAEPRPLDLFPISPSDAADEVEGIAIVIGLFVTVEMVLRDNVLHVGGGNWDAQVFGEGVQIKPFGDILEPLTDDVV